MAKRWRSKRLKKLQKYAFTTSRELGPRSHRHFWASGRRWGEDKERGNKPTTEDDGKSALSVSGVELAEGPTKGRKGER